MEIQCKLLLLLLLILFGDKSFSQQLVEEYQPLSEDSLRIGIGDTDFMAFIQSGYTLMLPQNQEANGVFIFLEDSGYDKKNKNGKQIYDQAAENGFAVLSVSTEIPFDFYLSNASILSTHNLIQHVFAKHNLPNDNIFFLGASLTGHRALKYIEFVKAGNYDFQLNTTGIVICNFTLDWTRKWYQHKRDMKINRIDLWEPTFINYMLETHLNGTPETVPENYHKFSTYSYFDVENENVTFYENFAVRAYIDPLIEYRLKKYVRTMYENNATDIVGFLAELELAGNNNYELEVLHPADSSLENRNSSATWDKVDKDELMEWVVEQVKK